MLVLEYLTLSFFSLLVLTAHLQTKSDTSSEIRYPVSNHISLDLAFQYKCFHIVNSNTAPEAVVQRCSIKEVFLKILRNSQENTCEFCEIFKNTFAYRTLPVAAFPARAAFSVILALMNVNQMELEGSFSQLVASRSDV